MASSDEIRMRAKAIADNDPRDENTAKAAREELTQKVEKIIGAFLTAIPGIISMQKQLKDLKKRNRARKELSDEVLAKAFEQMGMPFQTSVLTMNDIDFSIVDKMERELQLSDHVKKIAVSGNGAVPENDLTINQQTVIKIPVVVKEY